MTRTWSRARAAVRVAEKDGGKFVVTGPRAVIPATLDLPSAAGPLEKGEVEMAVIPSNTAYLAYTQGWGDLPRPHSRLRGIAALNTLPLQLVTTEASG